MKRHFRPLLFFLALGLFTTLGLAWLMAVLVDVQQGRQSQADSFIDDTQWNVSRWDHAGAIQISSVRIKGLSWSPQQAAGAPDTPTLGDQATAWASRSADAGTEWLILEYAKPVIPREIRVYESCGPGALFKVTLFDSTDHEIEAWSGTDPSPASSANSGGVTPISTIPISLKTPTRKIKLYLACDQVPGWNEIDAVALVAQNGDLQWARRVQASSTYASAYGTSTAGAGGNPDLLVPGWSHLSRPGLSWERGEANREERQVDARGWPMVALMSETDTLVPARATASPLPMSAYQTGGFSGRGTTLSGAGSGTLVLSTPGATHLPTSLPLHPIWIGLAGDALIFALAWFSVWSVLTVPRRFVREVARFRRGACIECGYDLGYDFIKGCPECGWRRDRQSI